MADVMQRFEPNNGGKRRRTGKGKKKMANKRQRFTEDKVKIDKRKQKLFEKRAREYNSDDEEDEDDEAEFEYFKEKEDKFDIREDNDKEDENLGSDEDLEEEDDDEGQPGVAKFTDGINAFRLAFMSIVKKKSADHDVLGPVLSDRKKLLAEKLSVEEDEKKVKGEVKKAKLLIKEKGHVKPENYLDAHEKFLLGVATKGVVKLFNAVNKAQIAQKGLNPSRSKDEKVLKKRRKEAFFSELGRKSSQSSGKFVKAGEHNGSADNEGPGWAPLRDNYMLTNPKLKDWDKMQDTNDADDFGRQSDSDSSSSE